MPHLASDLQVIGLMRDIGIAAPETSDGPEYDYGSRAPAKPRRPARLDRGRCVACRRYMAVFGAAGASAAADRFAGFELAGTDGGKRGTSDRCNMHGGRTRRLRLSSRTGVLHR